MKALSLFAAIVSLTLLAVPADASLINIDHTAYDTMGVGTADGHHVVGVLGGALDIRWNQINLFSSNTYTGLYDSRGIVTGTSFWATSVSKTLSGTDTVAGALFAGMLLDGGEFKFSGLTAGQAYELVLYSSWGFDGSGALFTVGGVTKTAAGAGSYTPTQAEGVTYVRYAAVVADGTGSIPGSWAAGGGGTRAVFSAAQIVPEPASLALLGLGGVALLARRRRAV